MIESTFRTAALRRPVHQAEIDQFWRQGMVCLRGILDPAMVAQIADAVDTVMGEAKREGFTVRDNVWRSEPFFRDLAFSSPLPALVASLLDSRRVFLLEDTLMVKAPGSAETPWHQDQPYYRADGRAVCTLWMPFDGTDRDNGALRYVPGSHAWGRWFAGPESLTRNSPPVESELEDIRVLERELDPRDVVWFDLEPGDCAVHHGLTVHGAFGNRTRDRRRRALACGYAGDGTRYAIRPTAPAKEEDPGLQPGDPLESDLYPCVFDGGAPATGAA